MNAELKKMKDAVDSTNETMQSVMRTFRIIEGSEDALLDMLERPFAKYYKSPDEKCMEEVAALNIMLGLAWNKAVDKVGDPAFHKDALTERFLKIILEE